jgi:molybdate transport system substrate-binding protein
VYFLRFKAVLAVSVLVFATSLLPAAAADKTKITVLAVALNAGVFKDVIAKYQQLHPDTSVEAIFGGQPVIMAQLQQGGAADIVILFDKGLAEISDKIEAPVHMAGEHEIIIVPKANPANIHSLKDFAKKGVRVGTGTDGSPHGELAKQVIAKAAASFGRTFAADVAQATTDRQTSAAKLLGDVENGTVDAAIGYASDASSDRVLAIQIPADMTVTSSFGAAILKSGPNSAATKEFFKYLTSPEVRAMYREHHFDQ